MVSLCEHKIERIGFLAFLETKNGKKCLTKDWSQSFFEIRNSVCEDASFFVTITQNYNRKSESWVVGLESWDVENRTEGL